MRVVAVALITELTPTEHPLGSSVAQLDPNLAAPGLSAVVLGGGGRPRTKEVVTASCSTRTN